MNISTSGAIPHITGSYPANMIFTAVESKTYIYFTLYSEDVWEKYNAQFGKNNKHNLKNEAE